MVNKAESEASTIPNIYYSVNEKRLSNAVRSAPDHVFERLSSSTDNYVSSRMG